MVNVVTDPEAISTGSCNSHSIAIDFVYSVHKIQSEHKGSLQRKVVYIPIKRLILSQTWMQNNDSSHLLTPPWSRSCRLVPRPQLAPAFSLPVAGASTTLWVPVPLSSRRLTGRTQREPLGVLVNTLLMLLNADCQTTTTYSQWSQFKILCIKNEKYFPLLKINNL